MWSEWGKRQVAYRWFEYLDSLEARVMDANGTVLYICEPLFHPFKIKDLPRVLQKTEHPRRFKQQLLLSFLKYTLLL